MHATIAPMKSQVISQQPALAYMRLVVSPVRYTLGGLLLGFMFAS
jgi:hypothetical protein